MTAAVAAPPIRRHYGEFDPAIAATIRDLREADGRYPRPEHITRDGPGDGTAGPLPWGTKRQKRIEGFPGEGHQPVYPSEIRMIEDALGLRHGTIISEAWGLNTLPPEDAIAADTRLPADVRRLLADIYRRALTDDT